jgi:hypothetical protein
MWRPPHQWAPTVAQTAPFHLPKIVEFRGVDSSLDLFEEKNTVKPEEEIEAWCL